MRRRIVFAAALALVAALGCKSREEYRRDYAEEKRAKRDLLLAVYPPGLPYAEVRRRIGEREKPDFAEVRPDGGWTDAKHAWAEQRMAESAARTGVTPRRLERYLQSEPTAIWFGLCTHWFYYDDADVLVDVEWEWHTD